MRPVGSVRSGDSNVGWNVEGIARHVAAPELAHARYMAPLCSFLSSLPRPMHAGRGRKAASAAITLAVVVATAVGASQAASSSDGDQAASTASKRQRLADLRVRSARADLTGTVLSGAALLENAGSARSRDSRAAVAWRGVGTGGLTQLKRLPVPALKPDRSQRLRFGFRLPRGAAAGSYRVVVCADVLGQVRELSERNNCRPGGLVSVRTGGGGGLAPGPPPRRPGEGGGGTPAPPDTTISNGSQGSLASTTATFSFAASVAGSTFQCRLDDGLWSACASPQQYTGLAQGPHTFDVRAVGADDATDPSPAHAAWSVDTIAPVVTLTAPAGGSTINDATPVLAGAGGTASGDDASVTVAVYAGTSASGTPLQTLSAPVLGGAWSVAAGQLVDGTYTARATQHDTAGNVGASATTTFTIFTAGPHVTLLVPPAGTRTNDTTPTFSGAAGTAPGDHATVTLRLFVGPTATGTPVQALDTAVAAGGWSATPAAPLPDGTYTAQASQLNDAGNTGLSDPRTLTVDTTPPQLTLTRPRTAGSWVRPGRPSPAAPARPPATTPA